MSADITPTRKSTLEDILSGGEIETKDIPGFTPGTTFTIQSLSAEDMIQFSEVNDSDKARKRLGGLRLIIKSVINEDGTPMMNEATHLPVLVKKQHAVCQRVVKEILKFNGMDVKDPTAEEKKD